MMHLIDVRFLLAHNSWKVTEVWIQFSKEDHNCHGNSDKNVSLIINLLCNKNSDKLQVIHYLLF